MREMALPKVSVCVITFNQEDYIRQCLQSIVDQKTNFDFEVIVGEDCSTDGTRQIVLEFGEKYAEIVKPIYHEKNVGGTKNLLAVHRAASGKYIAHIDGDDYMLPGKLQLQVDALDKNPDCTICVHKMKHFDQRNQRYIALPPKKIPEKSNINFLLLNLPFFDHSSKMYRAECRSGLEEVSDELLDCHFHIHHALTGNILYLNKTLGVYRLNVGNATDKEDHRDTIYKKPNPRLLKLGIQAIEYAKLSGVPSTIIECATAKVYFDHCYSCLMAKDFENFQLNIAKSLGAMRISRSQRLFGVLSNFPGLLFVIAKLRVKIRNAYCYFAI